MQTPHKPTPGKWGGGHGQGRLLAAHSVAASQATALQTGKETRPRLQRGLLQNRPQQDRALKEFMMALLSWKLLAQASLQQAADGPGQGGAPGRGGRPPERRRAARAEAAGAPGPLFYGGAKG